MSTNKPKRRGKRELKITIQRRGGANRDAAVEKMIREIAAEIFSTRMANTLRLTFKLRAKAGFTGDQKDAAATATWAKQSDPSRKAYTIHLRRDEPASWPRMIAHELRHVWQFATGRLRRGTKGGVHGWFWRPATGRATFFADGSIDYIDQPWEIDAREAEKIGTLVSDRMFAEKVNAMRAEMAETGEDAKTVLARYLAA